MRTVILFALGNSMLFVGRFPLLSSAIIKLLKIIKCEELNETIMDLLNTISYGGIAFIFLALLTYVADTSIIPIDFGQDGSKLKSGLIAVVLSLLNLVFVFKLETTKLIDILWISIAIVFCIIVGLKCFIEKTNKV